MANIPFPPGPPLDGVPPSPPGLGGAQGFGNNPPISMAAPTQEPGGSIQLVQMGLETAAAVAKGLDLLGQMFPGFQATAAMLQQQLRSAFKAALQQGVQASEPMNQGSPSAGLAAMAGPGTTPGVVQNPLPSLGSGLGM